MPAIVNRTKFYRAAPPLATKDRVPTTRAREGVAAVSVRQVARSVGLRPQSLTHYYPTNPARYHLMLQRTLPGFSPSEDSYRAALGRLTVLVESLSAAGVTDPADIALVRGLISGLAAEQIANDPQGRMFADQAHRGIRTLVTTSLRPENTARGRAPKS